MGVIYLKNSIPNDVRFILDTLESAGYESYLVGGCVRDLILKLEPNDWDISTSARPQCVKACFKGYNIVETGEKHGTIGVIINHTLYEITTFRVDGEYKDLRRPEKVEFTKDLFLDLSRRDFTINAIAYNDKTGFVDPYDGMYDISIKAIRCVGNPDERFNEDALRILRAVRFASVYDFNIEYKTADALIKNRNKLKNIAVERITTEFNKLLCGVNVNYVLRRYKDVIAVFLPEIVSTFNCNQNNPHHNKTVWKHTTCAVSNIRSDLLLRMVMLLHDIGKPMALKKDKKGIDHFYNHQRFSSELSRTLLERLKYPTSFIDAVVTLVDYHDVRDIKNKNHLKRLLNKIGIDNYKKLLEVQKADILAQSVFKREEKLSELENNKAMLEDIILNNECFNLKTLKINGSDLIHLGITKGVQIGYILQELLDNVIDDIIENDKNVLQKQALHIYNTLNKENQY